MKVSRLAALLAAAAGLGAADRAMAIGLAWNNSAGGAAGTASNWNPNFVPTANDDLSFNLNATYTVTFGALAPQSRTMKFKRGTVSLTMSAAHSCSTGITSGDVSGDVGFVTLSSGTITSNSSVVVGNASGSSGTLRVTGSGSSLSTQTTAGDLTIGLSGPGTLQVLSSGLVSVADLFVAGSNSTGTSTVTVSGAQLSPLAHSRLVVSGTGQHRLGQGGDLTMSVASGGEANFAGDVVVANGSASTSAITIGGSFATSRAKLIVAGDLLMGRNTSTAAAGSGTITVNSGGSLSVGGQLLLGGDPQGGTGQLTINDGGVATVSSLIGGSGGTLAFSGGDLTVNGPVLSVSQLLPISSSGGKGLHVTGGATYYYDATHLSPSPYYVGFAGGRGTLDVSGGSDITLISNVITGGTFFIADGAGSSGTVSVTGAGSRLFLGSALQVGNGSTAAVTVNSGGTLSTNSLHIDSPSATVTIGAGGTLELVPGFGSTATSTLLTLDAGVSPGSTSLILSGGTITGGAISIGANNIVNAIGDIQGDVVLASSSASLRLTGPLTLGGINRPFDATDAALTNSGSLSVGANTLTIRSSPGISQIGNTKIAGGVINADSLSLNAGCTLSGYGTLNVWLRNSGALSCGSGNQVLVIAKRIEQFAATISGSGARLISNGKLELYDTTVNCPLTCDAGSGLYAMGNATVGISGSSTALVLNGYVSVSSGKTLTLRGSSIIHLEGDVSVTGTLASTLPLSFGSTGSVVCLGRISTPSARFTGDIRSWRPPNIYGVIGVGVLDVQGNAQLADTASLSVMTTVSGVSHWSKMNVSGTLSLGGAVSFTPDPDFEAGVNEGDRFTIITAGSISGIFTSVDIPYKWELGYASDHVDVIVHIPPACIADFNSDGGVDFDDLDSFFAAWENAVPTADVNDDGGIDSNDIDTFFAAWESGSC